MSETLKVGDRFEWLGGNGGYWLTGHVYECARAGGDFVPLVTSEVGRAVPDSLLGVNWKRLPREDAKPKYPSVGQRVRCKCSLAFSDITGVAAPPRRGGLFCIAHEGGKKGLSSDDFFAHEFDSAQGGRWTWELLADAPAAAAPPQTCASCGSSLTWEKEVSGRAQFGCRCCEAFSMDGVTWYKPDVGKPAVPRVAASFSELKAGMRVKWGWIDGMTRLLRMEGDGSMAAYDDSGKRCLENVESRFAEFSPVTILAEADPELKLTGAQRVHDFSDPYLALFTHRMGGNKVMIRRCRACGSHEAAVDTAKTCMPIRDWRASDASEKHLAEVRDRTDNRFAWPMTATMRERAPEERPVLRPFAQLREVVGGWNRREGLK